MWVIVWLLYGYEIRGVDDVLMQNRRYYPDLHLTLIKIRIPFPHVQSLKLGRDGYGAGIAEYGGNIKSRRPTCSLPAN